MTDLTSWQSSSWRHASYSNSQKSLLLQFQSLLQCPMTLHLTTHGEQVTSCACATGLLNGGDAAVFTSCISWTLCRSCCSLSLSLRSLSWKPSLNGLLSSNFTWTGK